MWCLTAAKQKSCITADYQGAGLCIKFKLGTETVHIVEDQKYLGLYFRDNMDFNCTAKKVAQAANRSLGLLIAKFKAYGGIPYTCFSRLHDTLVDSAIQYGSCIW